ncbi:FAD-binding domain-containing protein [Xylaria sp. FL0043]|nr:FAD-binding domain-containing protein [Xylaria sp. FL0043]
MEQAIQSFKSLDIPVLEPGQAEYRRAIATSNLLFRFSRPDCVVRPRNAIQVQAIINEARSRLINVTIKCNGHSYAGHSTAFSGISLDLRGMKNVKLDMESKTVTMDAGCQWGDVYETLISGKHDKFIINGGRCPTVGVSGFILGGGLGPFSRSFGMGSDTLLEATLVTANGDLVTVKKTDDKNSKEGKLFWAIRGAGGGNFGVLVQMKLKVQELSNRYGMVVAGRYQWFPQRGFTDEIIATMNDFYVTKWPNKLTIDTTWICDLRQNTSSGIRFNVTFDGSKDEYARLIDKYIRHPQLKEQLKRRVLPEKSTRFLYETLVAQWLEETERAYPTNRTYELYSSFIFKNDDIVAINKVTVVIRDLMEAFRKDFRGEQVNFLVTWIHSGGRAASEKPTESAFFWREAVFHTYVTVEWVDKWMERDMRIFLAKVKKALRPLSLNGTAAFINFPDRDFPTQFHEKAYFGDNRDELRRVKQLWDPDYFFKWIQGVRRPGDPDGVLQDMDDDEDKTDQLASGQWAQEWKHYELKDILDDLNDLADLGYGEED